jgi:hypothetical protein
MAEELKPPFFLLGNVRSGTSMLYDVFDLHDDVTCWYEPRTIWVYGAPGRRHDRFDAADATPRVRRYVRKRFLKRQRRHGGRRIMEKTPSNILRIPYVAAIFPEAKLVYVVREPLANLSSSELRWRTPIYWHRVWGRFLECPKSQLHHHVGRLFVDRWRRHVLRRKHVSVWGVRYPGIYEDLKRLTVEEVIARQWSHCSRQAEEDLAALDPARLVRVRYEDFVTDPVAQYRRIAAHVDLRPTEAIEARIREMVDPGRRDKWRRLDEDVLRRCLPILRDEMARHGYEPPEDLQRLLDAPARAAT